MAWCTKKVLPTLSTWREGGRLTERGSEKRKRQREEEGDVGKWREGGREGGREEDRQKGLDQYLAHTRSYAERRAGDIESERESRAEQSRAEQSRAEQSAEQSRAEQSRAEQSKVEQSRAENQREKRSEEKREEDKGEARDLLDDIVEGHHRHELVCPLLKAQEAFAKVTKSYAMAGATKHLKVEEAGKVRDRKREIDSTTKGEATSQCRMSRPRSSASRPFPLNLMFRKLLSSSSDVNPRNRGRVREEGVGEVGKARKNKAGGQVG
eukprot:1928394-Rhodomonas_salina.1